MSDHIELHRTFWPVKDETDYDPDSFRIGSAFGKAPSDWSHLLQCNRVVILAEAGTGKTHELIHVTQRLIREGKSAFFCRIEDLADLGVEEAITEGKYKDLEAWIQGSDPAWFFLDSVDEARLANPRHFERALRRLAKELGAEATRAHIFITSRVSDWMASGDRAFVQQVFPCPPCATPAQKESPENPPEPHIEDDPQEDNSKNIKVFRLLPLDEKQMQVFATAKGVLNVAEFMNAIERADATIFAERPQDLLDLISFWETEKRIGLHSEMVEYNLRQKLAESKRFRDEKRPLSLDRAREGAERIAAALTFTKRNSVVLPDTDVDPARADNAILAKNVFMDWGSQEINALLDRALFDVATYGRVRIHHRSIREYLTAKWLLRLLSQGKSRRSIESILFATCYGLEVVIPSLESVVAWVALHDERVRQRAMAIAPEVLIANGDPSSLPVEVRDKLLRRFAALYANRKANHFSFDMAAVRRLADPALACCINELLKTYEKDEETTHLLLQMIWQGEIAECSASSLSMALDPSTGKYTRIYAIRAVAAVGNEDQKRLLVQSTLSQKSLYDSKVLSELCRNFFPSFISVRDLLEILENVTPPKRFSVSELDHVLENLFESSCPEELCIPLLKGIVRLLEREPYEENSFCQISKNYKWLFPHAAILARRAIAFAEVCWQEESVLRTVEMAYMAQDYGIGDNDNRTEFKEIIESRPSLRYEFFWRSIEKRRAQLAQTGERLTNFWSVYIKAPWSLDSSDFGYFLTQVSTLPVLDDRLVALSAACFAWRGIEDQKGGKRLLKRAVKKVPELEEALKQHLARPKISDEIKKHERYMRESKKQQEKLQEKREHQRHVWISKLQGNPNRLRIVNATTLKDVWPDLYWLGMELRNVSKKNSEFSKSDWEALLPVVGREVAEAARDGLMQYWRFYTPELKSEKDSNSIPNGLMIGMIGLAIEAKEKPDWPIYLNPQEATLAARYMTLEMNGFPPWAIRLLKAHPRVCDEVISHELQWEFGAPEDAAAPYHVLHDLQYHSPDLRVHYRPLVKNFLEQREPAHSPTLESALSILLQWPDLDKKAFAELARTRCTSSSEEKRFLTWLVAWMCVDAEGAFAALSSWLEGATDQTEADRRMINFSGALVDQRSIRFGAHHRDFERVDILRRLVPLVYSHVRREDDVVHEGAYTPGSRDNAETTRGYLLEKICTTPGRDSFDALIELSQALPHEWSRERMIVLARDRAKADAEFEPWNSSDIAEFEREGEAPPHSPRSLFNLTISRVDDIKNDLENGDYSEAPMLIGVDRETVIRNWFANRLRLMSNRKYTVTPEEELADATRPDLRLHALSVDAPVVIELKIADNWSYTQHSDRLKTQLVGQYLRDARSGFGIYLLLWQGKQREWIGTTERYRFHELLSQLQREADILKRTAHDVEDLVVIGIALPLRKNRFN